MYAIRSYYVEGGEDLRQVLRGDPGAVVAHAQHRQAPLPLPAQGGGDLDDLRLALDVDQGVAGVDQQVGQHLLDLRAVGGHLRQVGLQPLDDADLAAVDLVLDQSYNFV